MAGMELYRVEAVAAFGLSPTELYGAYLFSRQFTEAGDARALAVYLTRMWAGARPVHYRAVPVEVGEIQRDYGTCAVCHKPGLVLVWSKEPIPHCNACAEPTAAASVEYQVAYARYCDGASTRAYRQGELAGYQNACSALDHGRRIEIMTAGVDAKLWSESLLQQKPTYDVARILGVKQLRTAHGELTTEAQEACAQYDRGATAGWNRRVLELD